MKKKSNITVHQNIYPIDLTIATFDDIQEINNKYVFYECIDDLLNYRNSSNNLTIDQSSAAKTMLASEKSTDYKTILIILDTNLANKYLGILAHESVHYADVIFDCIGMNGEGYDSGDEHYAYLVEWCFNRLFEYVTRK